MKEFIFPHGPESRLPVLKDGEARFVNDTKQLFIGSDAGNIQLAKQGDLDNTNANVTANTSSLSDIAKSIKDFYSPNDGSNYSNALQSALNYCKTQYLAGITVTLLVPKGDYQLLTPVSIDGYTDSNNTTITFHLKMDGYFTAVNGIGKMLTIKNCSGCDLDIKAKGLNHTTDHLIYSTDWSANVTGIDVALYLESCTYTKLNFYGKRFFGRGIEANNLATNSWGTIRGDLVGQLMYIRGTSGFGSIGNIWVTEYMGSYFNVTDITVPYYENMVLDNTTKHGVVFDSCVSVWVDVMNVGNNSNDYEVHLLNCTNINISSMYIYGHNQTAGSDYCAGLHIYQSYNLNITLNTGYIKGNALFIEGIKASSIKLIDSYSENIGTITTTSAYGVSQTTLDIYSRYRKGTGLIVQKGAGGQAIDSLNVAINAKDRDAGNSNATDLQVIDTDSAVTILPATHANTIDIPSANVVKDIYSSTATFTNQPSTSTYTEVTTATTSLSGYTAYSSWNNTISRTGKNVVGAIALNCAGNNGNIAVNDVLASFDKKLAPVNAAWVPVMVKLSDGTIKMIDATLQWNTLGTQLVAQSAIATANISRVTANFAYESQN